MTTGLLVIDLQRGMFMDAAKPHDGEGVLLRVASLLERARRSGAPVLHVQHDGGPGDILGRAGPGWEIHPEVAPRPDEPVTGKARCSAFAGTALDPSCAGAALPALSSRTCRPSTASTRTAAPRPTSATRSCWLRTATPPSTRRCSRRVQIIAHHNRTLDGNFVELAAAGDIEF